MYKDVRNNRSGAITLQSAGEPISSYKVLFVSGRTIYLSTTTSIYKADISSVFNGGGATIACDTIVTMTAIYDGNLYAYDGTYIYFYAQLEELEEDEKDPEESDEEEEEVDEHYYLYRTKANKNSEADAANPYELLGKTQIESRHTK